MIIGITGTIGAGKGTVATYLKERGFRNFSVRDFLIEELTRRGLPHDRDHMTPLANELRRTFGPAYIIEKLYRKAEAYGKDSIIESIRTVGEVTFLKAMPYFHLIAVDADRDIRYDRVILRASSTDKISYEKFCEQEEKESHGENQWEQNLPACIKEAEIVFQNNGNLEALGAQVDEYLRKHAK